MNTGQSMQKIRSNNYHQQTPSTAWLTVLLEFLTLSAVVELIPYLSDVIKLAKKYGEPTVHTSDKWSIHGLAANGFEIIIFL